LASGATLNANVALVIAFELVGLDGAATGGLPKEEKSKKHSKKNGIGYNR
jgi:hypothetical protein